MSILFAFDGHKNKVAFDAKIPITVPMQLPDGSILFYDRGTSYGEYEINDSGYPERIDGTMDDGSAESTYWRYLICDSANLSGIREWGPYGTNEGMTDAEYEDVDVGYGLPNTETMLSKYSDNSTYLWQLVQNKRDVTDGKKWFVPSKDELNIVYQNKDTIVDTGGGSFPVDNVTYYWSSSESNSYNTWSQDFSAGYQYGISKNTMFRCRLLRRI